MASVRVRFKVRDGIRDICVGRLYLRLAAYALHGYAIGNHSPSLSSGACLRRRSHCHEFPPSRSVLSTSLRSHQSKIHRLQVGLHGSEPRLPWTSNPPSPVVRWARNAGLESSTSLATTVDVLTVGPVCVRFHRQPALLVTS